MTTLAGKDLIARARAAGRSALDEASAKSLLAGWGFRPPRPVGIAAGAAAPEAVTGLTPPFAAKVVSPDILHKSDVGGVMLGLQDGAAVAAAIATMAAKPQITSAHVDGWLIEEMVPSGREVVIGGFKDPQFGPMIMVGLGGVLVEVLEEVAFRLCPLTHTEAADMLASLKGVRMLDGVRGQRPVNKDALIDVIVRIGGENGLLM